MDGDLRDIVFTYDLLHPENNKGKKLVFGHAFETISFNIYGITKWGVSPKGFFNQDVIYNFALSFVHPEDVATANVQLTLYRTDGTPIKTLDLTLNTQTGAFEGELVLKAGKSRLEDRVTSFSWDVTFEEGSPEAQNLVPVIPDVDLTELVDEAAEDEAEAGEEGEKDSGSQKEKEIKTGTEEGTEEGTERLAGASSTSSLGFLNPEDLKAAIEEEKESSQNLADATTPMEDEALEALFAAYREVAGEEMPEEAPGILRRE